MSTKRTSSSCTGVYTAEMALAVLQKTVNDSGVLTDAVRMQPVCATARGSGESVFCMQLREWLLPCLTV